jgi:uncharacterized membrane protein
MKIAFALLLVALLTLPALATARIMLWRERKRQRDALRAPDRDG